MSLPPCQPRLLPGLRDLRKANDASPIAFRVGGGGGTCSIITHEDGKLNAIKGEVEDRIWMPSTKRRDVRFMHHVGIR